jgi:hypothetical protein
MTNEKHPDFTGKVVVLYVVNPPRAIQDGVILEYASFQKQGDRFFVVGRVPEIYGKDDEWSSNLQAGVAWDTVCHYLVFNSREDYMRRIGDGNPSLMQRLFGHS